MSAWPRPLTPELIRAALQDTAPPAPGRTSRILRRDANGALVAQLIAPPPGQEPRAAAVLVLLFPVPGDLAVVLTRRTSDLPTHAGQICFPGGRAEPADASPLETALREAREELGIDTAGFAYLGMLGDIYIPPSNFLVKPVVMYTPQLPAFSPSAGEVAEVLEVPLGALVQPDNLVMTTREFAGQQFTVPGFRYGASFIWGATAYMLDQLLARIEACWQRGPDPD